MSEKEMIEQEIRDLECDHKVIKYTEYMAAKKTAPYNIDDVYAERQAKRDKINELQAVLDAMERQEAEE